jgi:hypothetical protein
MESDPIEDPIEVTLRRTTMTFTTKVLENEELVQALSKFPFPWPGDPIPPWLKLDREILIEIFKVQIESQKEHLQVEMNKYDKLIERVR